MGNEEVVASLSQKMMGSLLPTDGEHFASLLDSFLWNIPVALGFVDTDLRFLRVNEALADLVDVPAEAHPGLLISEVILGLDDSVHRILRNVVGTNETIMNLEVERIRPTTQTDGTSSADVWLLSFYPIVGSLGEVLAAGIVIIDMTDRRREREERLRLLSAEQQARRLAEEAVGRLATLQALTVCFSGTRTIDDIATVVHTNLRIQHGLFRTDLLLLTDEGFVSTGNKSVDKVPEMVATASDETTLYRMQAEAARTGHMVIDHQHASGTVVVVPLVGKGFVLGLLVLAWCGKRPIESGDSDLLTAIGEQCVQAVERARLHLGELEARERLSLLAEASRLLASSLDDEATLAAVAKLVVPEVADVCLAYVQRDEGLFLVGAAHTDPAQMRMLEARVRSGELHPLEELEHVARTGEPVVYLGSGVGAPGLGTDALTTDRRRSARLAVPLRVKERNLGVLSLAMAQSGRSFRSTDLEWVGDLATRVAGAVDNARLYRERATVAHNLQRSLLPPSLPIIAGFEIAARYHPVGDGSLVGGDFYDVFTMREGQWGVVMGDASGKGVDAASLTSLARHTVRVAGRRESSPSKVLEILNQAIIDADVDERFCTIVHAWVEITEQSAKVRFSLGGHPSPLLVRADGRVEPVGRWGSAIGLFPDPELADDEIELFPGDALVLYTDGLTEARSPQGVWGHGLLEVAIEQSKGLDATAMAVMVEQAILSFEEDQPRDDIGLLVLRMPYPQEAVMGAGMTKRFYAEPTSVAAARHEVREWLIQQNFDGVVIDDVVLVISELVTNAVRVARSHVDVRAWSTKAWVTVEVVDDGDGLVNVEVSDAWPDDDAERGRGLIMVRALASDCEITPGSWGTMVRTRFARP
ncbi:MAG: SpoIIE family protein phosphatase [Acidimicrobiales bacterium]